MERRQLSSWPASACSRSRGRPPSARPTCNEPPLGCPPCTPTSSRLGEYGAARRWWTTARHSADSSGDTDMKVWVRGTEAVFALYSHVRRLAPTTGVARSSERGSGPSCRPPTSVPSQPAASTASTTDCCSARTYTHCSTADTCQGGQMPEEGQCPASTGRQNLDREPKSQPEVGSENTNPRDLI